MIVIGVTGSLASGKTEVAAVFKKLGARIFDADRVARRLIRSGSVLNESIGMLFGKEYLKTDGQINRKKLADHVFRSPKELRKLNTLIHPDVMMSALEVIRRSKEQRGRVLVLDVPLLFESRMDGLAGTTVLVKSTTPRMIERARKKGIGASMAKKILSCQWPNSRKEPLADIVITNNGSLRDLRRRAKEVFFEIIWRCGIKHLTL